MACLCLAVILLVWVLKQRLSGQLHEDVTLLGFMLGMEALKSAVAALAALRKMFTSLLREVLMAFYFACKLTLACSVNRLLAHSLDSAWPVSLLTTSHFSPLLFPVDAVPFSCWAIVK